MLYTESEYRSLCITDREILTECSEKLWNSRDRYTDSKTDPVPIREDEQKVLDTLVSDGYTIIGRGSARITLRFPKPNDNLVVKLSRYGTNPTSIGMWQNHNEIKIWTQYAHKDIPIAPLYDWEEFEYKWVVMPYGTPAVEETEVSEKDFEQVKIQLSEIDNLAEEEFTKPNFIVLNDTYYLADYGSLERVF